jgi:hypothetical protein
MIGIHDMVPSVAELAQAKLGPDQSLDAVSLASVWLGKQGDERPPRQTLLMQSGPGRDAFSEVESEDEPAAGPSAARRPTGQQAFNQASQAYSVAARKAVEATRIYAQARSTGSDGMAHALRAGSWKLVLDMRDKPAALYNLAEDLAEQKNLIGASSQAERVRQMEQIYREIRASRRSTPARE